MSLNTVKYKGELLAEDERISTDTPGVLGEYKELRADALEADTLDITVLSESGTIRSFKKNDKVEYFRSGSRVGVYYLQSVTRVGPKLYTLSALSAVGLLIVRPHRGGIYTGQTVAEVVAEICGDIPVLVETVYRGIKLYGWLPIASARDSLVQVLFAIGAWLHTDENGTLRVQKLWDGTASIIGPGSVHAANIQVKYLDPVSAVAVTEHQYIAGTEDVTLFEGTAQQSDVIEFDEPAHTLTAEGFTILESGANYAVLSAGTGKLTGKSYVHNRRVVTRTVTEGAAENVEEIADATLVSLVNSSAVAQRMAAYYACREQLTVDVNPAGEHAGHVVSLWNEWDKQQTLACIASRETKISGLLKSRTTALVGFLPPQPEATEYYDERVLLTGSGEWTVPEGVTNLRAVLIGGGQGGKCGQPGQAATAGRSDSGTSSTSYSTDRRRSVSAQVGGVGGQGGDGGHPGAVYAEDLTPTPGQVIAYACGTGGVGGAYEPTTSPDGADGTATTFGALSSALGSYSDAGYYDAIAGETYAAKGADGIAGGDGGGYDPDSGDKANPRWKTYKGASGVVDHDGTVYAGYKEPEITLQTSTSDADNYTAVDFGKWCATAKANAGRGASGGAAVGMSARKNWAEGSAHTYAHDANSADDKGYAWAAATGGKGSDGASAAAPVKQARYGCGGYGGNGGGGAGGNGVAEAVSTVRTTGTTPDTARCTYTASWGSSFAVGGAGSDGGQGADGCIIIYYRKFGQVRSGPLVQRGGGLFFDRLNKLFIV